MIGVACLAILLGSGLAFAINVAHGLPMGHALLNTEGATALSFLLLAFVRSRPDGSLAENDKPSRYITVALLGIFVVILIAYRGIFSAPFLYDDYTHITDAGNGTWRSAISAFGLAPNRPGLFFRPFGFFIYWLNYLWAAADPRKWHALNIALHGACCCLLYGLCRSLRLNRRASLSAALLFALSAASVEAVAWIDAQFDPMATCMVLACLLFVCRFLESGRIGWLIAGGVASTCAVLSKESAFCLPLLVGCLWFFRPERRLWIACGWITALSVALFSYRWWAIGGIGGYRSATGQLDVAHPDLTRTINAVLMRDWTILFFPVNWTLPLNPVLRLLLITAPIGLAAIAWWTRPPWRALAGGIALTTVAALPVQHLLLIGTDLGGSRVLYLLSIGWAVLWGTLLGAITRVQWFTLAIAWILTMHALMLRHNLSEWLRVPQEARSVCAEFARTYGATGTPIVVRGLPQKKNGVVFLANGFAECVAVNGPASGNRVRVQEGVPTTFVWNEVSGRVEPVR